MGRPIYFCDVIVSFYKGKGKSPFKMRSWVMGAYDTPGTINRDPHMMNQLLSRVYDSKYKGIKKCMVVQVVSVKFLGNSFYYD